MKKIMTLFCLKTCLNVGLNVSLSLGLSLGLGIALNACTTTGSNPNASASTNPSNSSGIANPAATFCEQRNGKHSIRRTTLGDVGYCVFSDRSACEEWSFFQGQCKMGDNPNFL